MKTVKIRLSYCFGLLSLLFSVTANAQKTAYRAPSLKIELKAPQNVVASDGVHESYVLIKWDASENAANYKVFRSEKAKGGSLQEISKPNHESTWLSDYTAQIGREYYYSVVATNGDRLSKASAADMGFRKKRDVVVPTEKESLTNNSHRQEYADPSALPLMLDYVKVDKNSIKMGEAVAVTIELQNIRNESIPVNQLRFFLSKDSILDFEDTFLAVKTVSSVIANTKLVIEEKFNIPQNLIPADYHIIAVSSIGNRVDNSQNRAVKINITR